MERYIKAKDVKKYADCYPPQIRNIVANILRHTKTADVVEVVRCRDCKHRPIITEGKAYGIYLDFPDEGVCPCEVGDHWYSWMPDDGFFCRNGERGDT